MTAAPAKRPYHVWKTSERRIVAAHYPAGGAKAAGALLPHRTIVSIYGEAARQGLRRPGARGRPRRG